MLQHNPHRHSILCVALGETVDGFQTREVDAKMVAGCPNCRCVLIQDKTVEKPKPKAEE